METWYERVRGRVPDAPVVRELIASVERLPGLHGWSPPHNLENHWTDLIRWGFVLWMTRSLASASELRRALATEILAMGRPDPETFGELSAAGLCVGLGAIAGGRIPPGAGKTADWRMVWPMEAGIDLEVTVARRKEKHTQREGLATALMNSIFRDDRAFDLVVHLADPTIAGDRDALLAGAQRIACGQTEEVSGRWQLRTEEITREPTGIFAGGQDLPPPWWSASDARCCVIHGQVAGPDTHRAPPQVRVWFGVPYDSYVNPVMRKADFPQCEPGLPFLVAVDVSSLPGAFREMPRAVAGFLPLWSAVSGILLFKDMMVVERVGWLWRLLINPHADVPLPDALCTGRADRSETMETGIKLAQERKEPESAA